MMWDPKIITEPTSEPCSVAEVKQHLRIDDLADATENTAQNSEISRFIATARKLIEKTTGRTIHQTTLEIALDRWPACEFIALPRATPLVSITSLKYLATDATETTVSASTYIADTYPTPGRLTLAYGESWPSTTLYPASPIRVRYVAGIATTSPITDPDSRIKQAAFLLVAGMWENRESEVVTDMKTLESAILSWGVNKLLMDLMVHEC